MSILLLNTNPAEGGQLARELQTPQHPVLLASDIDTALGLASEQLPVLLVIAEHAQGETRELITQVRRGEHERGGLPRTMRILVLPAEADELELLAAYDAGADLAAPRGSILLLRARIGVLLELPTLRREPRLRCGALEIDTACQHVTLDGRPVTLNRREYALLELLARDPHRVYTKGELMGELWSERQVGVSRTLDTHASRLRTKLAAMGGRYVENCWGVGYQLRAAQPRLEVRA